MSASGLQIVKITGPLLLCTLIDFGLHGVLCMQLYTYYLAFPSDRLIFKILVYGVFIIETLQVVLVTGDAFDLFVKHLGDIGSLDPIRFYWLSGPVLTGIVAAIGQLFFAYRLRVLSKSWVPAVPVMLLAIMGLIASMVLGALSFLGGKTNTLFTRKCYIAAGIWNTASIACDIVIMICMVHYLTRHKSIFNSCMTRRVLSLVKLIIETGTLTATITILAFIVYICFKETSYLAVPLLMTAKLYSNTMMLILNNRITIIGGRNETTVGKSLESRWHICEQSQGGDPALDEGGEIHAIHEVWRDGTNSDCLKVTYTTNTTSSNSEGAEIFRMTRYSSSSTNLPDPPPTTNNCNNNIPNLPDGNR